MEACQEQVVAPKAWKSSYCNGALNSSSWAGEEDGGANSAALFFPPSSAGKIFAQTRLDKCSSMTNEGKLTIHATPWANQFRDDIEALNRRNLSRVTILCVE